MLSFCVLPSSVSATPSAFGFTLSARPHLSHRFLSPSPPPTPASPPWSIRRRIRGERIALCCQLDFNEIWFFSFLFSTTVCDRRRRQFARYVTHKSLFSFSSLRALQLKRKEKKTKMKSSRSPEMMRAPRPRDDLVSLSRRGVAHRVRQRTSSTSRSRCGC